jgi:hypothetical protein
VLDRASVAGWLLDVLHAALDGLEVVAQKVEDWACR